MNLPRYDRSQTYAWNYEHAPQEVPNFSPAPCGSWSFCDRPVSSPLGIAAGPLLNGRWVLYYAALGFDVLTYKTVRSQARECYPLPNLQPVACGQLQGSESRLPAVAELTGSWAVSFGMPSQPPHIWRADIQQTRRQLPAGKLLSVSVVGTMQEGWTIDDLAADYARCAHWAVESGADCIEANFSCPNVSTCDGQLYQDSRSAALVAQRVRAAIGRVPFLVKIGHVEQPQHAEALATALSPWIDGLAMTNSIATTVVDSQGQLLFGGQPRGICGEATREASIGQVRLFSNVCRENKLKIFLVGVGGARSADDVRRYLAAGAGAVHLATAAMLDPKVGLLIRQGLAWDSGYISD